MEEVYDIETEDGSFNCGFPLIVKNTDSSYIAISGNKLDDVIKPEMRADYEKNKNNWLAYNKFSNRTPGLFKLEFEGDRGIALCAKCYFVEDTQKNKNKNSSKGVSKRQNKLDWERYMNALKASTESNIAQDRATNVGFRMRDGTMFTYTQEKLGLSSYYDKRTVLPDLENNTIAEEYYRATENVTSQYINRFIQNPPQR